MPQLPQLQNLIPELRHLPPGVKVLIAQPSVLDNLAGPFAGADGGDVADLLRGGAAVEPDALNGCREKVFSVFVVFDLGGDVVHVLGLDAHHYVGVGELATGFDVSPDDILVEVLPGSSSLRARCFGHFRRVVCMFSPRCQKMLEPIDLGDDTIRILTSGSTEMLSAMYACYQRGLSN